MTAQAFVKWGLVALFALAVIAFAAQGVYWSMMALWGDDDAPAQSSH